jgi:hypothetical protein
MERRVVLSLWGTAREEIASAGVETLVLAKRCGSWRSSLIP